MKTTSTSTDFCLSTDAIYRIAEGSSDPFAIIARDFSVLWSNGALRELLDDSVETLLGVFPESGVERLSKMMAAQRPVVGERLRMRRGDDWLSIDITVIPNDDHFYVAIDPSAENRESEQRRARRLGQMELAERYAGLGHWHVDLTSLEVSWSPVIYEIHGVESESFEPDFSSAIDFFHPDDRPRLLKLWTRALEEQSGYEIDARIIRPDGTVVHVISKAQVQVDDDGDAIGVFGIFQDVTEREREGRRRAHADRLTALGTLAAGLAHEINNPLAFLTANLEYAADVLRAVQEGRASDVDVAEAIDALADASSGAGRVDSIVSSLRTFGGSPSADPLDFDLVLLLEDILSGRPKRGPVIYESSMGKERARVSGDGAVVGKVIEELLDNAERAVSDMEGREPVIGVYLSRNGEYYVVEVVDNGPGMEREVAEKAFEPFFSTYDVDDGHGLGLSSCLGIVNSLGGTIEIASRLEKGTTVTVTLPVAVGATNDADHPDGVEEPQEPIVYVVDDEPLVGRAIKRTLGTGYSLEFFTDADAALRALENGGSPAAIICDIMMPGKTGVDLFRVVEANHPGLVDAFVFLSGGVFSESMETRLKAIKAPRVTKPFSPDHLRETVCQIVSRT